MMSTRDKEHLHRQCARELLGVYWGYQCATDDTIFPLDEVTLGKFLEKLRTDVSFQNEIIRTIQNCGDLKSEFHPTPFSLAIDWLRENPIMVFCYAVEQLRSGKDHKEE